MMESIIVAIPNDAELAASIGKKGSENSITFYNRKAGTIITALTPSNVEEKFYALPQCILMSDIVLLSTKKLDSTFGEALIACELAGKEVVITSDNDVSQYLSRMKLNFRIAEPQSVLEEIQKAKRETGLRKRVDIDKAFPVKGIGTVLLGIVRSGAIAKHDRLFHNDGKLVEVRSIQAQDEDKESAGTGTRVGLAVKGIEDSEVEKGDILSEQRIERKNDFGAEITASPQLKGFSADGFEGLLVSGFSSAAAKITKEGSAFKVHLDKPMPLEKEDLFLLVRKTKPRICASGKVS